MRLWTSHIHNGRRLLTETNRARYHSWFFCHDLNMKSTVTFLSDAMLSNVLKVLKEHIPVSARDDSALICHLLFSHTYSKTLRMAVHEYLNNSGMQRVSQGQVLRLKKGASSSMELFCNIAVINNKYNRHPNYLAGRYCRHTALCVSHPQLIIWD